MVSLVRFYSLSEFPCEGQVRGMTPKVACRDATRKAILYSIVSGQIVAEMLGSFSENYLTKIKISRDPVVRIC